MEENEPMSTITRQQAQQIIEAADEVITALAGTNEDVHPESDNMLRLWDDLNDRYAPPEVVRELARIALASLEAEPVAWRYRTTNINGVPTPGWSFSEDAGWMGLYQPLYAATPAPIDINSKPVAWDYEWASCTTCEGPQNFKRVIEREAPPEWAVHEGQARNIIPLYRLPEIK